MSATATFGLLLLMGTSMNIVEVLFLRKSFNPERLAALTTNNAGQLKYAKMRMQGGCLHLDAKCTENAGPSAASRCTMQVSGHRPSLNGECAFASIEAWEGVFWAT